MSSGGPRHGSGKPPSAASRDHQIRIMMTEAEHDDIQLLAQQWDVPLATAAYGVFTSELSRIRRCKPHSPVNLVLAASAAIAKHEGSMTSTKHPNGE